MEKFDSVGTTMAKTASDSRPIPWRTAPSPPSASPPKQVTEININPCHGHGPGDHRGFEHGVCGCASNCGNCCMGTFCGPCLACSSANRMGSSGPLFLLLSCFCFPLAMCLLRRRARNRLGLTDDDAMRCEDCCAAHFCTQCVNCQVANELDSRL